MTSGKHATTESGPSTVRVQNLSEVECFFQLLPSGGSLQLAPGDFVTVELSDDEPVDIEAMYEHGGITVTVLQSMRPLVRTSSGTIVNL